MNSVVSRSVPVTLVLVSYNKADVVGLAIESAASGSVPPDLIVISDDGSDDGTPEVAEETARKVGITCCVIRHPRVGIYRIQAMRNTCAANALEGVVYLSDSDCVFGPNTIETHCEIHQRFPMAIGTGPRFEYLAGTSGAFTSTFATLEYSHFPDGIHCVPVGANISFRKSLWRELGGFDRAFDGSYGMEEFEFTERALREGACAVSDPGAYVFHCPHPTVFGDRLPLRNMRVFNRKYEADHLRDEGVFVRDRVTPWYWSGRRKAPLLGAQVELDDEWGAPPGFVPPIHLQLSRTLKPLIEPVDRVIASGDPKVLAVLDELVHRTLDTRMLAQTSPSLVYAQELQWITQHLKTRKELVEGLREWRECAIAIERTLRAKSTHDVQFGAVPTAQMMSHVRSA
ncbi:MAG: glycosyltransferase [Planctomycetota bacterium]